MELKKLLEDALRDVEASKTAVANELDKGGNIPFAYARLVQVEKTLKNAIKAVK